MAPLHPEAVEVATPKKPKRSTPADTDIVVTFSNEMETVRLAVQRLRTDPDLYAYQGNVYVATDSSPPEFRLIPREMQTSRILLGRGITWKTFKDDAYTTCLPPVALSVAIYDELVHQLPKQLDSLLPLEEHSVLPDGRITPSINGYIPELRRWVMLESVPAPSVERNRASEFRRHISDVLAALFSFRAEDMETELAGAKALLSTLAMRRFLRGPVMPVFIIQASQAGSGKSTLGRFIHGLSRTAFREPRFTADAAELDKAIATVISEGAEALFFDNVRGKIASTLLETMATNWGKPLALRLLGVNKTVKGDFRQIMTFSVNGARVNPDMRRRCIEINLGHPNGGKVLSPSQEVEHERLVRHYEEELRPLVFDLTANAVNGRQMTWREAYEAFWGEPSPMLGTRVAEVEADGYAAEDSGLEAIIRAWPEKLRLTVSEIFIPSLDMPVREELEPIVDAVRDFFNENPRLSGRGPDAMRVSLGKRLQSAVKRGLVVDERRIKVSSMKHNNKTVFFVEKI